MLRPLQRLPKRLHNSFQRLHSSHAQNPTKYCVNVLRQRDYESFLIGHLFPKDLYSGYFALKAFSVELATVQDNVSSPVLGNMRMQFWRDALNSIDKPPNHPIAVALSHAIQKYNINQYHLKRIIEARDTEIRNSTHLTTDSFLKHSEATSSSILYLLLSLLKLQSSELDHAASHLGAAQTIVTLLRALPFHLRARRMVIPADITAEGRVVHEDVFRRGPQAEGFEDAVFKFATLANDHLVTARERLGEAPKAIRERAKPVFMSMVPVGHFLKTLEKVNFNVFEKTVQQKDGFLPIRLWRTYYFGKL
ncbi:Squalene/phytoene synthase [Flagelloscypha sp. PMI_526]|nr:Squalene/phytoene synthase [Flagelloscypha sp. PMI_526]